MTIVKTVRAVLLCWLPAAVAKTRNNVWVRLPKKTNVKNTAYAFHFVMANVFLNSVPVPGYLKALNPVTSIPVMSKCISCVPS